MYKDPEEREQQIKNISAGFRELADGILPQLRRARMIINYQIIGRDDSQIIQQIKDDPSKLSVEELLYGATLFESDAEKAEATYRKAAELYPKDARAFNNVGIMQMAKGNTQEAQKWFEKARQLNGSLPEANANLGLLALQKGNMQEAENYIAKASDAQGISEILGNLHLAQGKYAQAENDFSEVFSNSAALAYIMNQDYAQATATLKHITNPDATTDYLKAIVAARTNNMTEAAQMLQAAIAKDPKYAEYAAKDLELSKLQK
jgi:Flp pilus assembly protein TadD